MSVQSPAVNPSFMENMLLPTLDKQNPETMLYALPDQGSGKVTVHQIDFRTDANKKADEKGNTWLHIAVMTGNQQMLECFFAYGKDLGLEERNHGGFTPLMLSVEAGRLKMTQRLIEKGADPRAINFETGRNVFHIAVEQGDTELATLLLEKAADLLDSMTLDKDDNRLTALHLASLACKRQMVKFLLDHKAKITEAKFKNQEGVTPLFLAALEGDTELLTLLVEAGDDPQRVSKGQSNVLHYSVNNLAACQLFLNIYKVNPNQLNLGGFAPYHYVNSCEILECFLVRGIDVDCVDGIGQTLLSQKCNLYHWEEDAKSIILLLKHHANPNQVYKSSPVLYFLFNQVSEEGGLYGPSLVSYDRRNPYYLVDPYKENRRNDKLRICASTLQEVVAAFIEHGAVIDFSTRCAFDRCKLGSEKEIKKLVHGNYNQHDKGCIIC